MMRRDGGVGRGTGCLWDAGRFLHEEDEVAFGVVDAEAAVFEGLGDVDPVGFEIFSGVAAASRVVKATAARRGGGGGSRKRFDLEPLEVVDE